MDALFHSQGHACARSNPERQPTGMLAAGLVEAEENSKAAEGGVRGAERAMVGWPCAVWGV